MKRWTVITLAAAILMSLNGCGVYKGLNMHAHSTVGLNVDRSPPNARIGITRDEEVVTPSFAGGRKPNVAAGFNASYNPVKRLLFSVSSFFTGGQAAANLTNCGNRTKTADASQCVTPRPETVAEIVEQQVKDGTIICLAEKPTAPNFETKPEWLASILNSLQDTDFPDETQSKLFVFTTDSIFGFKATWLGTDVFPNKLDAGFNRKEYAYAPLIMKESKDKQTEGCQKGHWVVKIPSYFAYINVGDVKPIDPTGKSEVWVERLTGLRFGYNQLFATGKAAENLAADPDMQANFRAVFLEQGAPPPPPQQSKKTEPTQ